MENCLIILYKAAIGLMLQSMPACEMLPVPPSVGLSACLVNRSLSRFQLHPMVIQEGTD